MNLGNKLNCNLKYFTSLTVLFYLSQVDNSYYIYKNALDADIYVKREDGSNFEGL